MSKKKEKIFIQFGAPAIAFMVLGSIGLARFVKGRNEVTDNWSGGVYEREWENHRKELWKQQQEKPFDLEEEYEVAPLFFISCCMQHPLFC